MFSSAEGGGGGPCQEDRNDWEDVGCEGGTGNNKGERDEREVDESVPGPVAGIVC